MTPEHRQPAAQASPGWPASVPPVSQASPSAFGPAGPAGLAAPPVSGYPVGQGSPPPGPGVLVPFSAPPTERDRKRLWITLGISGFLLLLCCVGGVVGFGGLIVESNRATEAASVTVVHDYLEGLRTRNFGSSYNQLCPQLQQQTSRSEFQSTQESHPLGSYSVGTPRTVSSGVSVPATLQFQDGSTSNAEFLLVPEGSPGSVKICGINQ